MNYQDSIDWLFSQTASYQQEGATALKVNLTNILALCDVLNNPQHSLTSIHVGGTNGKGSTTHLLTSILMESGYKTATFTSPHYVDFRERIRINGQYIPKEKVIEFIRLIQVHIPNIQPSFFELTFAMALWYFAQEDVDIAVIEVGLGGRLDSTNIIQPLLSIITNIGLDHQQFLGTSLPEIASEKAGIIKANTPVIIGSSQPEVANVFITKAEQEEAPIYFADQELEIVSDNINIKTGERTIEFSNQWSISTSLLGKFQAQNIRTAIFAATQLQQFLAISATAIQLGIKHIQRNSTLIGRFQIMRTEPLVIIDSSHNAEGVEQFLQQIKDLSYNELHIIYGCVSDKDVSKIEPLLIRNSHLYLTQPSVPRKLTVTLLRTYFSEQDYQSIQTFSSVEEAYLQAQQQAQQNDLIILFGSIFLISDLLQ